MHFNQQIAWLNEVMRTKHITISHALNGHRLGAGESYVQIESGVPVEPQEARDPRKKTFSVCFGAGEIHGNVRPHAHDYKKKKQLKVDGFHWDTNTVYEYHGCYWHGCPVCFEQDQIVPQCRHVFKDKNTGKESYRDVRMGDLYAATQQKMERLRQNGFKVVQIWEHEWLRYCRQNRLDPKGDLPKLFLEPLIPREAYFGGRVNCTKMYYTCVGTELLFYTDVTSMYPHVMNAFDFPIGIPKVLTRTGLGT